MLCKATLRSEARTEGAGVSCRTGPQQDRSKQMQQRLIFASRVVVPKTRRLVRALPSPVLLDPTHPLLLSRSLPSFHFLLGLPGACVGFAQRAPARPNVAVSEKETARPVPPNACRSFKKEESDYTHETSAKTYIPDLAESLTEPICHSSPAPQVFS
ncbi:hypothetical protein DFH08DRAFT_369425 [Mycena albidolilacea]|uniref:Uncharacterized protein n=1 Tax=Mycena albidolilacea TaxID=1033008 RepID=A0AAD7ALH3_9AGAR|nr:hypothetical protein DFH08DRAFT_369425 [Mycena albidolilacea]